MAHYSNSIIHGIHGSTMTAQGDISIHSMINRNSEPGTRGIDLLFEASAPGAFHDSGERFDPPKCHPRTRTHILSKIVDWIVGAVGWDGFIMWLYGPAGSGKSAIAQTIAELCHARHALLASFFFSRTDPKRNNEKSLIASIAFQIALNLPEAKSAIETAVKGDPAIFHRSVETQFTRLILEPLSKLSATGFFSSTQVPYLIIIDGLDECHDRQIQQHILHTIPTALQHPYVPLMFLICSRAEQHLSHVFTSMISGGMATHLSLDDGYEQNADIERYLIDSFHEISTMHPLKAYIPTPWPSPEVLSTLVRKSSGQFIYAATVIKYISCDLHQPTRRLEIILSMKPHRKDRPFADLDALYMGILSSVEDVEETIQLLGVLILTDLSSRTPKVVGQFMSLDPDEVHRLLLPLASVVECVDKDTDIQMLHASFPDFLLDRSRSAEFHIDSFLMHAEIAQLCLSHIREQCKKCFAQSQPCFLSTNYAYRSIVKHLTQAEPSADLREALVNTDYITSLIKLEKTPPSVSICNLLVKFLSFLKDSKFTDTEELYLHHRNIYDGLIHKRIADFPLDAGFVFYLVLIEMRPHLEAEDVDFELDCIGPLRVGIPYFHSTLSFDSMKCFLMTLDYSLLLGESLRHPVYAGKYVLDGQKYALVARLLLDYVFEPSLEYFLRQVVLFPAITEYSNNKYSDLQVPPWIILELCSGIETLLSKVSHSDELIARINHTNLILNPSLVVWLDRHLGNKGLQTLIQGIGNYLMRVVGSVPIWFHLTVVKKNNGERELYFYDTDIIQF